MYADHMKARLIQIIGEQSGAGVLPVMLTQSAKVKPGEELYSSQCWVNRSALTP